MDEAVIPEMCAACFQQDMVPVPAEMVDLMVDRLVERVMAQVYADRADHLTNNVAGYVWTGEDEDGTG